MENTYHKITVKRVEVYERTFLVPAKNKAKAMERIKKEYEESDYIFEKLTDYATDGSTTFKYNEVAVPDESLEVLTRDRNDVFVL